MSRLMTGGLAITWDRVPLRDICEQINYGYTASAKQEPIGPKFLRITDIVDELVDWGSVPYCRISDREFAKYELQQGDIVIARTGATSGYAKMIRKHPKAVFASYLVRLRIKEEHDWRYVGLVVESDDFKRYIKSVIGGAAQPQANAQVLTSFPIPLPPLPTQHKIAAILSAYDDLIENNTRRIRILEEMAQMIYREWFVNFRFPGHEKVKMVDSELGMLPEGWEVASVGQIVKRVPSGKKYDQKTVSATGTVPVFDQGRSGIIGYHDDEPGVLASEDAPIIVFANHTCYQRLVMFSFSAIQNVLPFTSSLEYARNIFWLHYATKDLVTFNDYKGHWPEFMAKRLILPSSKTSQQFGGVVEPLTRLIFKLEKRNQILRRTRDLLLPKLISGEIDMEGLGNG